MPRGRPPSPDILTPAEWRVVEAIRHGLSNGQIAARRGFSINAVKFHVANELAKLGFKNRAALRQWSGIAKDSALATQEVVMSEDFAAIGQVSRSVRDIAAATRWYSEVLGLNHLYSFGDLAFLIAAAHVCFSRKARRGPNPFSIFALAIFTQRISALRRAGPVLSAPRI